MTTQVNLSKVWAETGGVTNPGDAKYTQGWVSEIPTFQNFNFVLQTATKNILANAEKPALDWQTDIEYAVGASVVHGGLTYFSVTSNNLGNTPVEGGSANWKGTPSYSNTDQPEYLRQQHSLGLNIGAWEGMDNGLWSLNGLTVTGRASSVIALDTALINYDNVILANHRGELIAKYTSGVANLPDGNPLTPSPTNKSYRIFHEGLPPNQSQVPGTIPDAPVDGRTYGRRSGNWIEVTLTTHVGEFPPTPALGKVGLWYSLADGRLYIDISDSDSSQWVPASPTYTLDSAIHKIDTTGLSIEEKLDIVGLSIEELQFALGL